MIKDVYIKDFRYLENVMLEDTKKINILVGENNSGKTSILEAMQLFRDDNIVANLVRIARNREVTIYPAFPRMSLSPYDSFINTFNKKQGSLKVIELEAETDSLQHIRVSIEGGEYRQLYLREENLKASEKNYHDDITDEEIRIFKGKYYFEGLNACANKEFEFSEIDRNIYLGRIERVEEVNINYLSPIDHYTHYFSMRGINNIIKSGDKHNILKLLKIFDQNIVGFETVGERGRTIAYIKHKSLGMVPLSVFGDGLKKILAITASVINCKNGILLIDEIETAIHKKALVEVFGWFIKACSEFNVQAFLSTHSIEAIDALLEGLNNNLCDIVCYRLENYNDKILVNRYSGEKLYKIRNNQGLDVR